MKDALEEAEGLTVNGQNFNNLRYADGAKLDWNIC